MSGDPVQVERACKNCGCTDDYGCAGGCWWVAADLCSACSQPVVIEVRADVL